MRGILITFEGSDGAGKTLQSKMLMKYLHEINIEAVLTREPGGTSISEKIRDIILDNSNSAMVHMTEALLYAASRAQHVHEFIMPALKDGKTVVCDRFVDSSVVYQGIARGLGIETIEDINNYAAAGLKPDLTFFLDLPPEKGLKRKYMDTVLDRIEKEKMQFHQMVYQGYCILAERYADRIHRIDASKSAVEIHHTITGVLSGVLKYS